MKVAMKETFKKVDFYTWINIAMLIVFVYQIGMLVYVNLTQLPYHLGYDASSNFLVAMERGKLGTLFPVEWENQTTLYLDSPGILAAFFYAITKNIFFSYGLSNLLILFSIITMFYVICKKIKISSLSFLIIVNLFLCPYVTMWYNNANDLSWLSSILTGPCYYTLKVLHLLLIYYIVLNMEDNKKGGIVLILISSILSSITGLSSGYYMLVSVIAPVFIYLVVRAFMENDWKTINFKIVAFLVSQAILIILFKRIAATSLNFTSKDSNMMLVGLRDFWKNLGSIFLGFIQLLGGLHLDSNVSVLTADGMAYLSGFAIVGVSIIAIVFYIRHLTIRKNYQGPFFLALIIMAVNVGIFVVVYTTYGEPVFEARYLWIFYIMAMLLVAYYIDHLADRLLWKRAGLCLLLLCIGVKSYTGYYYYNNCKIDMDSMYGIIDSVGKVDSPVVYMLGSLVAEARNLRVLDVNHIYKTIVDAGNCYHWGDYTYYDENGTWKGENILIAFEEEFEQLPSFIKQMYIPYDQIGNRILYHAKSNRFDFTAQIGITEVAYDYMNTPGIQWGNGDFDNSDGTFITNGTEGYALWGPSVLTRPGTYDISLDYEVIDKTTDDLGYFEVVLNGGNVLATANINDEQTRVTLSRVKFVNDTDLVEYRYYSTGGTRLKLKFITISQSNANE